MHPVGSYCRNISRCTVNKTSELFKSILLWAAGSCWLTNSHRRFWGRRAFVSSASSTPVFYDFLAQSMKAIWIFETSKAHIKRQNVTNPQDSVFSITTIRISVQQIKYLFVGYIRPCKFWLFLTYQNISWKFCHHRHGFNFIVCVTKHSAAILHSKLTRGTGLVTQTRYCENFEVLYSELCRIYR